MEIKNKLSTFLRNGPIKVLLIAINNNSEENVANND